MLMARWSNGCADTSVEVNIKLLRSICVEFGPRFMLYVVDKCTWDFYMENANFSWLELTSSTAYR